jgi:transcriptional regulator with XRE-family HTH domain
MGRTVKANGEKIQRLRIEKGWTVSDAAAKTGCSDKTVENVERGANVYLFTLAKFAKAFGVEYPVLVSGGDPSPELPKKERRFKVQITVDIPFEEFDESQLESYISRLERIVHPWAELLVAGVEKGSTILTLEMRMDDIERLIDAFGPALDDLRIERVQLPDSEDFTLRNRGTPMEGVSFGEPLRGRVLTRVIPTLPPKTAITHLLRDILEVRPAPEQKPADTSSDE